MLFNRAETYTVVPQMHINGIKKEHFLDFCRTIRLLNFTHLEILFVFVVIIFAASVRERHRNDYCWLSFYRLEPL